MIKIDIKNDNCLYMNKRMKWKKKSNKENENYVYDYFIWKIMKKCYNKKFNMIVAKICKNKSNFLFKLLFLIYIRTWF